MKKIFTLMTASLLLASGSFVAKAQDFQVPDPQIIVPIGGQAELLGDMFEITWGYYGLVDNAGDDPIQVELTFPDGTVKNVKGTITDANKEGEAADGIPVPTTQQNALMFRNFMEFDADEMRYIQQYGTYVVNIPAGIVLVNGVENSAAELNFKITGIQEEQQFMAPATLFYPDSYYTSILSSVSIGWDGQEISFTDPAIDDNDNEYIDVQVVVDGVPSTFAKGTINKVMESGPNDDTESEYYILNLYLPDFIFASEATIVDFIIEEGIVENTKGDLNPEQTVTFTLFNLLEGTPDPESGSKLEKGAAEVLVIWEGIQISDVNGDIIARSNSGDVILPVEQAEEGVGIIIDLSELEAGSYDIIIPEGYLIFLVEEGIIDKYAMNSEMILEYTIEEEETDGISSIESTQSSFDVYSINGTSQVRNGGREALKDLKPGIYIINGKKTVLR